MEMAAEMDVVRVEVASVTAPADVGVVVDHALVGKHIGIARAAVRRYERRAGILDPADRDDLVAVANLALCEASATWQEGRSGFGTFARLVVGQRVAAAAFAARSCMSTGKSTHWNMLLERSMATKSFSAQHGRPPTRDELAERIGWRRERFDAFDRMAGGEASMDQENQGSGGADGSHPRSLHDHVGDVVEEDAEEAVGKRFLRRFLAKAVAALEPRERKVIELRYLGSEDVDPTLEVVGRAIGRTRERVRQIEKEALEKLAKHFLKAGAE